MEDFNLKLRNMVLIGAVLLMIFMVGAVCATDNVNSNYTVENGNDGVNNNSIEDVSGSSSVNNQSDVSSQPSNVSNVDTKKVTPIKTKVKYSGDVSKYKKSKYFKIKIIDKKTKKPVKNLKFKFKVKLSKGKYKTYTLKTNKNGIAKYNLKKLKPGVHLVYLLSSKNHVLDDGNDKTPDWSIGIWKTKKTTHLKMNKPKKVNGEYMRAFYETHKNRQEPQGVHVRGDIGSDNPGFVLLKTKFFFKNKKTGKIISKTAKYPFMSVKLIKGYKPVEVKVWYGTLR